MPLPPRINGAWFIRQARGWPPSPRKSVKHGPENPWVKGYRPKWVYMARPDVYRAFVVALRAGPDDWREEPRIGGRIRELFLRGRLIRCAPMQRQPLRLVRRCYPSVAIVRSRRGKPFGQMYDAEEASMLDTLQRVTRALRPQARAGLMKQMQGPFGVPKRRVHG